MIRSRSSRISHVLCWHVLGFLFPSTRNVLRHPRLFNSSYFLIVNTFYWHSFFSCYYVSSPCSLDFLSNGTTNNVYRLMSFCYMSWIPFLDSLSIYFTLDDPLHFWTFLQMSHPLQIKPADNRNGMYPLCWEIESLGRLTWIGSSNFSLFCIACHERLEF